MKISNQTKHLLFAAILVMLALPFLQMEFSYFEVESLSGSIKKESPPVLNRKSWFNESYQNKAEKYLNQQFGFRNRLVRLSNQIKYDLFNTAQANGVIIGKDSYLYEIGYINAYYGKDFLGSKNIDKWYDKLKTVQDSLKKYNTDIIMVFAPGKASFFDEFIPDKFDTTKGLTNRQYFAQKAMEQSIPAVDFSSWFLSIKKTSPYHLYPKTGIHWSYYGMNLAMDSLVKYIERLKNIDMPEVIWDSITISDSIMGVDNDIEEGMNLLNPIANYPMPYPNIRVNQTSKTKPKTIIVADSYYWQIQSAGYSSSIFDNGDFWFYNNEIHTPGNPIIKKVDEVNLLTELKEHDIIILMATEPTLKKKYWGFVENAYHAFMGIQIEGVNSELKEIETIKSGILKDKNWVKMIREKAANNNIDFEEMLQKDAEYVYRQQQTESK